MILQLSKKYCIIFGTASQAEHPFPAGCSFCTHFYIKGGDVYAKKEKIPKDS